MDYTGIEKNKRSLLFWFFVCIILFISGNKVGTFLSLFIMTCLLYKPVKKLLKNKYMPFFWLVISILLLLTRNIAAVFSSLVIIMCLIYKGLKWLLNVFKKSQVKYTLAEIDEMNGYKFEEFMKGIYENMGYSVEQTPLSGDQGADLILTSKKGIRTAVQVKRYSNKVSNKAVQEVVAAKGFHKCTEGIVVTNSYFTNSARQLAEANNIDLVDRTELIQLMNKT